MRRSILALVTMVLVAGAGLANAQTSPGDPDRGAQLFTKNACAACHGPSGKGGQGPALLGPDWKFGGDDASLAKSIRDGHQPLMPPMGAALGEQGIKDVIAYMRRTAANLSPEERARVDSFKSLGAPKGVVRSDLADFRVETVAHVGPPYAFDFLPDGRILVTETAGPLRVIDKGKLLPDPVADTPNGSIEGMTQALRRAMLSVAVHPDYARNGWVYLLTARVAPPTGDEKPREGLFPGTTTAQIVATITRGRIKDMRWVDTQKIAEFPVQKTNSLRMKFDARGRLYVGTLQSDPDYPGDGPGKLAQDLMSPIGKILRMKDDGSVPPDNPFVGRADANPYVFSYGHREPSGLTFDAAGELGAVEDGPRGGDELNHIRPGRNYGWPISTWGHRYDNRPVGANPDPQDIEQPVFNWNPAPAVSDVEYYAGKAFPRWTGSFFIGTMKQRDLIRVAVDGDRARAVEVVLHKVDRFRDIATGPDGYLYALLDGGDLIRLVPAEGAPKGK